MGGQDLMRWRHYIIVIAIYVLFWLVEFDPGSEVTECSSVGENDIILNKFDSDGNFLWARTWGGQNIVRFTME